MKPFENAYVGMPVWDVHGKKHEISIVNKEEKYIGIPTLGKISNYVIDYNGILIGYPIFGQQIYPYPVEVVDKRTCGNCISHSFIRPRKDWDFHENRCKECKIKSNWQPVEDK